jgi:hypothetical protein
MGQALTFSCGIRVCCVAFGALSVLVCAHGACILWTCRCRCRVSGVVAVAHGWGRVRGRVRQLSCARSTHSCALPRAPHVHTDTCQLVTPHTPLYILPVSSI